MGVAWEFAAEDGGCRVRVREGRLHLLLATLGLIGTTELAAVGALGMTVALVSAAVLLLSLLAPILPTADRTSPAHPARAIDISSPLAQSDPDASGHPRPRAPGFAASAA